MASYKVAYRDEIRDPFVVAEFDRLSARINPLLAIGSTNVRYTPAFADMQSDHNVVNEFQALKIRLNAMADLGASPVYSTQSRDEIDDPYVVLEFERLSAALAG